MTEIDVEAVRADTPGAVEVIHLNNAGAALVPKPVLSTVIDYLEAEARMGGYEAATSRAEALDLVYKNGGHLINADPSEISYVNSATQGWFRALESVKFRKGDRALVSSSEYVANVFGLAQLRRQGVKVEVIPDDRYGTTSVEQLESMLTEKVKLVCVTHVPTGGGLINPVAGIGNLIRQSKFNPLYLVDAAQSVGQMTVDVEEIKCDFLVTTGRKFLRAPRGTGLLYMRSGLKLVDPRVLDGRSANWTDNWIYRLNEGAQAYETFETNMAAKAGFGVAIGYALDVGLDPIAKRISELTAKLRSGLNALPLVDVVEHDGLQSGIVTFRVQGRSSQAVVATLRAWGINTSLVQTQPSLFDPTGRLSTELVRASVHYYNTEDEIDMLLVTL